MSQAEASTPLESSNDHHHDPTTYTASTPSPERSSPSSNTTGDSVTSLSAMASESEVNANGKPLTDFHCFPRLPTELRLKIWRLGMPEGRIIEVLWHIERGFYTDSTDRTPAILHACPESRFMALKNYTALKVAPMVFSSSSPIGSRQYPNQKLKAHLGVYIDPSKDTLYYSKTEWSELAPRGLWDWFLRNLEAEIAQKLQKLAAGAGVTYYDSSSGTSVASVVGDPGGVLLCFPELRSISIILSDICYTNSYSTKPGSYSAPRRAPLAITNINLTKSFIIATWDLCEGKAQVLAYSPQTARGRGIDASAISRFRQDLIGIGLQPGFVNGMEINFGKVVRGDSSWDGMTALREKFEASFRSGEPTDGSE